MGPRGRALIAPPLVSTRGWGIKFCTAFWENKRRRYDYFWRDLMAPGSSFKMNFKRRINLGH